MNQPPVDTTGLLKRMADGGDDSRSALFAHACDRLRLLTRRMLRRYPGVRRWEQTDDVLQNVVIRLLRALEGCRPQSSLHFWNLASQSIRRELLDLARHHFGPEGHGANHHTDHLRAADDQGGPLCGAPAKGDEPSTLAEWSEFYEGVECLPEEEREIFDLLWIQELDQKDAASVLGVSLRTVRRRWQSARLLLAQALRGEPTCGKAGTP